MQIINNKTVKQLRRIWQTTARHWVGDGFPVRTLLAYSNGGEAMSPFLLLDYGGPTEFPPTEQRRGVGLFELEGESIRIKAAKGAIALLLSGEPLNEPIVGHGPFVMNSTQEIHQAIADYQTGKMGKL